MSHLMCNVPENSHWKACFFYEGTVEENSKWVGWCIHHTKLNECKSTERLKQDGVPLTCPKYGIHIRACEANSCEECEEVNFIKEKEMIL